MVHRGDLSREEAWLDTSRHLTRKSPRSPEATLAAWGTRSRPGTQTASNPENPWHWRDCTLENIVKLGRPRICSFPQDQELALPLRRWLDSDGGEERTPCTWPLTFLVQACRAFGLLKFTTFISSSLELAMPSTLAPDRLGASSRRVLSRETRPPGSGEVTLSQELRTVGFLRPHVLVGYQWSHTGLCPEWH